MSQSHPQIEKYLSYPILAVTDPEDPIQLRRYAADVTFFNEKVRVMLRAELMLSKKDRLPDSATVEHMLREAESELEQYIVNHVNLLSGIEAYEERCDAYNEEVRRRNLSEEDIEAFYGEYFKDYIEIRDRLMEL